MKYAMILLVILTSACGDDLRPEEITWGDAVEELAYSVCERLNTCGGTTDQTCVDTIVDYLCTYDRNCDVYLDEGIHAALDECMEAVEIEYCPNIELGYLPAECAGIWDFEPEPGPEPDVAGGGGDGQGSNGRGRGGQR